MERGSEVDSVMGGVSEDLSEDRFVITTNKNGLSINLKLVGRSRARR